MKIFSNGLVSIEISQFLYGGKDDGYLPQQRFEDLALLFDGVEFKAQIHVHGHTDLVTVRFGHKGFDAITGARPQHRCNPGGM